METKYITIPFDVERAKRITNGEEDGKIVTRDGRNVRIVCWDVKNEDSILALAQDISDEESPLLYQITGQYYAGEQNDRDLLLSVPEWTTFNDGDIIATNNGYSIGIVKGQYYKAIRGFCCKTYVKLDPSVYQNPIKYDVPMFIEQSRYATDEEKKTLIEALKKSEDAKAKDYSKLFFVMEETANRSNPEKTRKECELKPKDWVLRRESCDDNWKLDIFSHAQWEDSEECYHYYCVGGWDYECIPYEGNEKLLGTKMGLEDLK